MVDALATLRRLRQMQSDQARLELAASLAAMYDAELRTAAAQVALQTEARAIPLDAAHPLSGSFANWLPAGQAAVRSAAAAERAAQAHTEGRRAALAEARATERAVETVQDARAVARRTAALKREQIELDDFKPRS